MEDNDIVQFMIVHLQVILNNLKYLGTTISQYDIN